MENPSPFTVVTADAANRGPAPQLQQDPQLQQSAPNETQRRTGVDHTKPCTASEDANAPVCQLFHQLPSWNRVLWHISLQLQEVDAPGELSLVRVSHEGIGRQQEQRSSDARVLFNALLASHRCVTRADLTNAVFEGGPLNEIRELSVRSLRENESLRILNVATLPDCSIVRADIFTALARMVSLQELHARVSEEPRLLVEALVSLVSKTTALKTLDIPDLVVDGSDSKRLSAALHRNRTVTTLSVHTSILTSRSVHDAAHFSRYLRRATWLASLTVSASRTQTSHEDLRDIIEPLLVPRMLSELTLIGFQFDARCVNLLAQLVAQSFCLERLNIASSYWIPPSSQYAHAEELNVRREGEQERLAVSAYLLEFVRAFTVNKSLKFLALYVGNFAARDLLALFNSLARAKSLQKILVKGIGSQDVRAIGQAIRDGGLSDRVLFQHQYSICLAVLTALEDFQALNEVIVDTRAIKTDLFKVVISRLPVWRHVTRLRLLLTEDSLDNATVMGLARYFSETTALRELWLVGCNQPDLRTRTTGTDKPHSLLLEALFSNKSVTLLHIARFVFGEANLRFLAEAVRNSDTLCEFHFSPLDKSDNLSFIRFLVPGIAGNHTLLRLHASASLEEQTTEDQFVVEDVLVRNRGLVTCAAQFVINNVRTDHCAAAMECVSRSPGLVERVRDLACVDQSEAVAMIQRSMQEPGGT